MFFNKEKNYVAAYSNTKQKLSWGPGDDMSNVNAGLGDWLHLVLGLLGFFPRKIV